jgi:hypothetical protein
VSTVPTVLLVSTTTTGLPVSTAMDILSFQSISNKMFLITKAYHRVERLTLKGSDISYQKPPKKEDSITFCSTGFLLAG